MKNIFENAKFGDKFLTKNGHKAVLLGIYEDYVCVCIDDGTIEKDINLDGTLKYEPLEGCDYTIVSCYQEPIDEEKLDKLANEDLFPDNKYSVGITSKQAELELHIWKRGYRKAIENHG